MRMLKLLKRLIAGAVVTQVAFSGLGGLPGSYVDRSELVKEFERKHKPLSGSVIASFNRAAEAHYKAAKTGLKEDWLTALTLYQELANGFTAAGQPIDLLEESHIVNECLHTVAEALGYHDLAVRFQTRCQRLKEELDRNSKSG